MAEEKWNGKAVPLDDARPDALLDRRKVLMYIADIQAGITSERYTGAEKEKHDYAYQILETLFNGIANMPFSRSDVVLCRDCGYWKKSVGDEEDGLGSCLFHNVKFARAKGFCYWGRKREGAGKEEAGEEEN